VKKRCTRAGVYSDWISCHSFAVNACRVGAAFIEVSRNAGPLAYDGPGVVRV
jgi:hypothetical protein